jgi:glyoxylase-like metal-dependent hydrolase (beta-lactamase superfamily II)/rhodanese-related sulfurtransferase
MLKKLILSCTVCTTLLLANESAPLTSKQLMAQVEKQINSIDTQGLVNLLKEEPNIKVIDVRNIEDMIKQGGYLKTNNLSLISRDKLEFMIANTVFPDEKFVIHCYTGNISLLAAKALKDMGYKNVIWYKDSFKGWNDAKLETRSPDYYPTSMLYKAVEKVTEGVYTSIGEMSPGTYYNVGHNNNLGFVVGNDAVAVWNAGSTYLLARALHEEIKKVTDKPVKYVVLENSQMHAAGGSNYWKEQGAKIVAHELSASLIPQKAKSYDARGAKVYKDKYLGTVPVTPDITFKENYKIDLGGTIVEAKYFGHAHEHDDIALWVPNKKVLFAGDIGFYQRLLPIFKITDTQNWIKILEEDFPKLDAKLVVPGHGDVTTMENIMKDTKGYLTYLRSEIETIMDDDGDLTDAYEIDMNAYKHMDTYQLLGRQNIARLWNQMEFE